MIYNIESHLLLTKYHFFNVEADSEDEAIDILDEELEEFSRIHNMCLLNYEIEEIKEENE